MCGVSGLTIVTVSMSQAGVGGLLNTQIQNNNYPSIKHRQSIFGVHLHHYCAGLFSHACDLFDSVWLTWSPVCCCQVTQGCHNAPRPHQHIRHYHDLNFDTRGPQEFPHSRSKMALLTAPRERRSWFTSGIPARFSAELWATTPTQGNFAHVNRANPCRASCR